MSDNETVQPAGSCEAHGCPLPGVMHRGPGYWCFVHFGADCDLQTTTNHIRANERAFWIVLRAANLPLYDWPNKRTWIANEMTKLGHHALVPQPTEERQEWVYRVRELLRNSSFVSKGGAQAKALVEGRAEALESMKKFSGFAPRYNPDESRAQARFAEEEPA